MDSQSVGDDASAGGAWHDLLACGSKGWPSVAVIRSFRVFSMQLSVTLGVVGLEASMDAVDMGIRKAWKRTIKNSNGR